MDEEGAGCHEAGRTRPTPHTPPVTVPCWSYIWGSCSHRGGWRQVGGGQQLKEQKESQRSARPGSKHFYYTLFPTPLQCPVSPGTTQPLL